MEAIKTNVVEIQRQFATFELVVSVLANEILRFFLARQLNAKQAMQAEK